MRRNLKSALRVLSAPALVSFLLTGCSGEAISFLQLIFNKDTSVKEQTSAPVAKATATIAATPEGADDGRYERLQAVWALWQNAVRDGVPDEILAELKMYTADPAPELSGMAKKALADLLILKEKQKTAPPKNANSEMENDVSPHNRAPQDSVDTEKAGTTEYIAALSALTQNENDVDKRAAAVNEIGLHRNGAAVEALTISATDADSSIRYNALQKLWFSAADGLDKDGTITATLELAISDRDPKVAQLAQQALADLRQLNERNETDTESVYVEESGQDLHDATSYAPSPERVSAAKVNESMKTERFTGKMDELATRARFGADAEERSTAVNELGHYRTDESVDLLTEVAADADPEIRYQAVKSLWYSAADGLDKDGKITDLLHQSVTDRDPRVADVAKQALEDLKNLEEKKQEIPLEPSSSLPPDDPQNLEGLPPHPPQ